MPKMFAQVQPLTRSARRYEWHAVIADGGSDAAVVNDGAHLRFLAAFFSARSFATRCLTAKE